MPSLNVCGKIYHCVECGFNLAVEYKGGCLSVFLGDQEIFRQKTLAAKYGGQLEQSLKTIMPDAPNKMLSSNNYLYEEAICEKCFKNKNYPPELTKEFDVFFMVLNSIMTLTEELADKIKSIKMQIAADFISNITYETLREIDEKCFDATFGKLKKPNKKNIAGFIKLSKDNIINYFKKLFSLNPAIESEYSNIYAAIAQNLSAALSKSYLCGKQYYTYKNVYSLENFHNILTKETTVRKPVKKNVSTYFYYESVLDEKQFRKIISKAENVSLLKSVCDIDIIQMLLAKLQSK
ncbi:MAG: hypothetical protein QMC67_13115 [Candidatus Wallbacteria bacterium]